MLSAADISITEVLRYFTSRNVEVAFIVPTETGMRKSIMDATASVRDFLSRAGVHDFDEQPQGQEHKRLVPTRIVTCSGLYRTETSLYRPVTKQGDPRLWVAGLKAYAEAGNVLALVATGDGELLVINASNAGLVPGVLHPGTGPIFVRDADCIDLDKVLSTQLKACNLAAEELLARIRAIAHRWHPSRPGDRRDFEVGRLLEELLGIQANSSRLPDYKGIEIKASRRRAGVRQTLFAKVADWSISPLKSSAEILDAFGYARGQRYLKQLRCTVSAKAPNTQGLFLVVEENSGRLLEASNSIAVPKVAYWPIGVLQDSLLVKHPETFWVSAATRRLAGNEEFKYEHVLHTRRPLAAALPTLLETGTVTMDHLITRDLKGRVSEQGPLFKISRRDFDLLFPPGQLHVL